MKKTSDIYTNVETFDVIQRNKTLLRLKGDEVNGKNIAELEEIIGEKLGEGTYFYSIKEFGSAKKKTGKIRGVVSYQNPKQQINNNDTYLQKHLQELDKKFDSIMSKDNHSDYKQVMELQKNIFDAQLSWYKAQNEILSNKIEKLEKKIDDLESEDTSGGGLNQILSLVPMFLNKGKVLGAAGLKDNVISDSGDIPSEFIEALGKVDYSKVSDEQKQKILQYFNIFSNQLPLKQGVNNG